MFPLPLYLSRLSSLCLGILISGLAGEVTKSEQEVVEIPFVLTEHNNWVVEVVINEEDSLRLMLHSASTDVMLTEEGVKKTKSVNFETKRKVKSWGGESDLRVSLSNRIRIGAQKSEDVTIWEDKHSGHGTDGKFGLDLFPDQIVEVDFDRSLLKIHRRLPEWIDTFESLLMESDGGPFFVSAQCIAKGTSYPNTFMVHSGYSGGLLLDDDFAQRSGVGAGITILEEIKLKDSFGNEIPVRKGTMESFQLGHETLREAPVGFFGGGLGKQKSSVMGGEILKQFHLVFDLNQKRLYAKRRDASAAIPSR